MTKVGPQHMDFVFFLMTISAVKWCVFFLGKFSVCFFGKLLNSECVLPSSVAVTSSTVLVLPFCSPLCDCALNIKSFTFLFCIKGTTWFKVSFFWYNFVVFVGQLFLFFKKYIFFPLKEGNDTEVCALSEKDHCQPSIVNYKKKLKYNMLSVLSDLEKVKRKKKHHNIYIRKK